MFIRSLQAKCAKFHTRDGPGKGRSHYKELHCQVPLPAAPWSSFQLLESVEAPGQKPRDNAFKDGDTSRKEAGEETQETPWKGVVASQRQEPRLPEAPCSHSFSGTHPFVRPGKESQLSVGHTCSGHTVVCSSAQFQPVILRCLLYSHTPCAGLSFHP